MRDELVDRGFEIGRKRVVRLMRQQGLQGVTPRKFRVTTDSDHDHPVPKNAINRDFVATKPNQKWVAGITFIWTAESWLYLALALVLDLFSRRVVVWSIADHVKAELCLKALAMAPSQRSEITGLVHHSDRRVQYVSARNAISEYIEIFCNRVRRHSTIGSMSPAKFEEEARVSLRELATVSTFWGQGQTRPAPGLSLCLGRTGFPVPPRSSRAIALT